MLPHARHSAIRRIAPPLVIVLLLTAPVGGSVGSEKSDVSDAAFQRTERARIQAHLARVESRLRDNTPLGLTVAQRRTRAIQLDRLAAYRRAGHFPHNHDFHGRRVPYFVDEHGTRCAMAYLIEASGRADLVRTIQAHANNARVVELVAMPTIGTELAAALVPMGLTAEEAQAIQPAYTPPRHYRHDEATSNHAQIAAYSGTTCLAATVLNILGPGSKSGRIAASAIGAAAGAVAVGVGMAHLDDQGDAATLGIIETGVGGLAILVAGAALLHHGDGATKQREVPHARVSEPRPSIQLAVSNRYPVGVRMAF